MKIWQTIAGWFSQPERPPAAAATPPPAPGFRPPTPPPLPVMRPPAASAILAAPPILQREYASPHFRWTELQCKGQCAGCGHADLAGGPVRYVDPDAIAKLEALRVDIGAGFSPSSAARCPRHNALVGGAPLSQHRSTEERPSTAFDIPLVVPKARLIEAAEAAGFQGIGINYRTFVHVDNRPTRARW